MGFCLIPGVVVFQGRLLLFSETKDVFTGKQIYFGISFHGLDTTLFVLFVRLLFPICNPISLPEGEVANDNRNTQK